MTTVKTKRTILIPFDTEPVSSESMAFIAALAKYLNASVSGLFVVNPRTLEAANLPFAFEISRYSAQERSLHLDDLARLNRKTANEAQRWLTEISLHYKISVSFSTLTGELIESAFSQPHADILFFPRRHAQLNTVLGLRPRQRIDELVLLYDASPQAAVAVRLAQQLYAHRQVSKLTLLYENIPPMEVIAEMRQMGLRPRLQAVNTSDPLWLRALHLVESNLALIPKHILAGLTPRQLAVLFADSKCQVLLLE